MLEIECRVFKNFETFDEDEIQVVKDGKYGNEDVYGEWDGMVGELVRRVSVLLNVLVS
jgi:hypothetical protein